ncbi:MAG: winged helix-turn-helix transcriptional regulator [Euryarchaeota archaeon]|nr:winged helix-turn-helix transcriptional regulator [Euryarchaeota archaeon]
MIESHDDEIQKKIYDLIYRRPGLHLSKIAEQLTLNISEVENHLSYLEKNGLIISTDKASYKQYYPPGQDEKKRDKRSRVIRKKIHYLIVQNPGLHLSRIAELLKMSIPSVDYHLLCMERNREILAVKDDKGYYKRYYVGENESGKQETIIFEIISKKVSLKIVLLLLKYRTLQHKEILKRVPIASSTLSYHLAQLVENEILVVDFHGEEKGYNLKDPEKIIRVLKKYEVHIELHLAVESFIDLWDDLRYRNEK